MRTAVGSFAEIKPACQWRDKSDYKMVKDFKGNQFAGFEGKD